MTPCSLPPYWPYPRLSYNCASFASLKLHNSLLIDTNYLVNKFSVYQCHTHIPLTNTCPNLTWQCLQGLLTILHPLSIHPIYLVFHPCRKHMSTIQHNLLIFSTPIFFESKLLWLINFSNYIYLILSSFGSIS